MFGLVTDLSYAQWRRCIEVDLDSVFLGTRAAIPLMRRSGGGSIINISSMAGMTGQRALSAYCAAKGGVRFFSKAVRSEEHTSELQSLMRNSYAVFCLKKKKHKRH